MKKIKNKELVYLQYRVHVFGTPLSMSQRRTFGIASLKSVTHSAESKHTLYFCHFRLVSRNIAFQGDFCHILRFSLNR